MKRGTVNSYVAVECTEQRDSRIIEREIVAPKIDEIAVAIKSASICGSDLRFYRGDFASRPGTTPSHEFSARVVALGRNVSTHLEGDLVGVEPHVRCGLWEFCFIGDYTVAINAGSGLSVKVNTVA